MRRWRRCSCSWYADLYVAGVRRVINVGPDEEAARRELSRLEYANHGGRLTLPGGPALDALARRWLAAHEARPGAKVNSLHSYRSRVGHLIAWFGDVPVTAITPAEVRRFVEALLADGKSAATVGGIYAALRSVLVLAQSEELIEHLPLPARSPVPKPNVRRPLLTAREGHEVVQAMPEPWRGAGLLVILTGLRIGEVLALAAADVDLERAVVNVRANQPRGRHEPEATKTEDSTRTVALPTAAVTVLAQRAAERPAGRLWPGAYRDALETLDAAMRACGVKAPGRAWHELRKVHALLLRAAGIDIRDAAAQLGHGANFVQTMAYQWTVGAVDAAAVEAELTRHVGPPADAEGG